MAATGLLSECPSHAANLVAFGAGMIRAAARVRDPITGQPLRIRIGINSVSPRGCGLARAAAELESQVHARTRSVPTTI